MPRSTAVLVPGLESALEANATALREVAERLKAETDDVERLNLFVKANRLLDARLDLAEK